MTTERASRVVVGFDSSDEATDAVRWGAAYAAQPAEIGDATPLTTTGMGALEYLLFGPAGETACPAPADIDATALRARHAARLARHVATVSTELRTAWEPGGGNFVA